MRFWRVRFRGLGDTKLKQIGVKLRAVETSRADWRNFADVRDSFRHADAYCDCVVFNIKGNDYRLITIILYPAQHVYVRHALTHAEYDGGKWKDACNC